jgi:hypothetical protein
VSDFGGNYARRTRAKQSRLQIQTMADKNHDKPENG